MQDIPIALYSGAGNEFVVIDAFTTPLVFGEVKIKDLARTLCNRKGIIGSDGMIVLGRSGRAPFMMNFYNPDGSFGALCGNGARCAVQAAFDAGIIADRNTTFEVLGEVVSAEATEENRIRVQYNDPKKIKLQFKLSLGGELVNCHYVDLGSQHSVIFFDEIEKLREHTIENFDIERYGSAVRNHTDFQPLGANANFVQVMEDQEGKYLRIRTFERGVEGETAACGTGCMSSAIVAYGTKKIENLPIRLKTQSGEFVQVNFNVAQDGHIHNLTLEGSAIRLRRGVVSV